MGSLMSPRVETMGPCRETSRRLPSRRQMLRLGACAWAAAAPPCSRLASASRDGTQWPQDSTGEDGDLSGRLGEGYPRPTGRAGRGIERFDAIVLEVLDRFDCKRPTRSPERLQSTRKTNPPAKMAAKLGRLINSNRSEMSRGPWTG